MSLAQKTKYIRSLLEEWLRLFDFTGADIYWSFYAFFSLIRPSPSTRLAVVTQFSTEWSKQNSQNLATIFDLCWMIMNILPEQYMELDVVKKKEYLEEKKNLAGLNKLPKYLQDSLEQVLYPPFWTRAWQSRRCEGYITKISLLSLLTKKSFWCTIRNFRMTLSKSPHDDEAIQVIDIRKEVSSVELISDNAFRVTFTWGRENFEVEREAVLWVSTIAFFALKPEVHTLIRHITRRVYS